MIRREEQKLVVIRLKWTLSITEHEGPIHYRKKVLYCFGVHINRVKRRTSAWGCACKAALKQTCPQQRGSRRREEKETQLLDSLRFCLGMFESEKSREQTNGLKQHLIQKLLYCTGEMQHFHTYMQGKSLHYITHKTLCNTRTFCKL